MRFYQSWGEPWQSAAQRAQQCTIAYRSRQQPTAEEATAIMSPFFYQLVNGRHAAVNWDRRSIHISYVRTDEAFEGDFCADNRECAVHVIVCAASRKAREVAGRYENDYERWAIVGTLMHYNTPGVYNRIFEKEVVGRGGDIETAKHYVCVTDTYNSTNLALLFKTIYEDMGMIPGICSAVLTRDPGQLAAALNAGVAEMQVAQEALEAEARREQAEREERERQEAREQRAENPFKNLQSLFPSNKKEYPSNQIDVLRQDINTYLQNIRNAEAAIRDMQIKYMLETMNDESSEFTAFLDALKADPDIIYSDHRGIHIHTLMRSWDLDHAESLYDAGSRVTNAFAGPDWYRALMHELFCTCETKIMFKGFYRIRPDGTLQLNSTHGLKANPHHQHYNCFGEYTSLLSRAYSERAYMQWYGLFKACISTVNILDGPVMDRLKQDLLHYTDIDYKWLLTDGEYISTREWKEKYENNELHIQPGAAEEPGEPDTATVAAGPEDGDAGEVVEGVLDTDDDEPLLF